MMIVNDKQWKIGLSLMYPVMREAGNARLSQAAQAMYHESQNRVHVVTGRLKASGRVEEQHTADEDIYEVVYGGDEYDVDYAGYEESYHPFLTPSVYALSGVMDMDGEISVTL